MNVRNQHYKVNIPLLQLAFHFALFHELINNVIIAKINTLGRVDVLYVLAMRITCMLMCCVGKFSMH